MITVHHLNNSRSQRVLWLLEELGVAYDIRRYERDPHTMLAPPELKQVHPLGKSPVVTDQGHVLAESGAIIEFLLAAYAQGDFKKPAAGTPEQLRFTYWLHYAEGSLMPPLLLKLVFGRVAKAPVPFFVKPVVKAIVGKVSKEFIDPQMKMQLDFCASELSKNEWFAGKHFSAADIQMSFPLEAAVARGDVPPPIANFVQRIHERPAYQRALAKGGPFELLS